jgi:pimeloyl-ACP methyl ester carboxylesterase
MTAHDETAPRHRDVDVQGMAIRIVEAGEGPVVLLLHGIPDTAALWDATIESLASTHRCIAIDLPGFGGSAIGAARFDWSLDNRGRFLDALLSAAGIEGAVSVIAHDAGGTFAVPFIGSYPHRCMRALFCITSMHPDFRWHPLAEAYRRPGEGEQVMAQFNRENFTASVRAFSGPAFTDEHIEETFSRITDDTKETILHFYRSTNPDEFGPFQERFERATRAMSVSTIWGARNPGAGEELAQRSFPGSTFVSYEDVGHWPMIEAPKRWIADVRRWLQPGDL